MAGLLLLTPIARAQEAPTGYTAATEEVSAFNAALVVGADGWLDVTETISYYFPAPKHGIFRAIPVEYIIDGKTWRTPLNVVSVMDDRQQPITYAESRDNALWQIKIGSADRLVSGLQTYVIRYRVAGVTKRFADHDELYWNITGNQWQVPIRRVAATVVLPAGTQVAGPAPLCYVGPAGSTSEVGCVKNVGTTQLTFAAGAPMTLVVGFTPGVIALTSMVKPPFPWLDLLPLFLPLLALFYMFRRWWLKGRDPAGRGTIVVQYDPPDQLPPGMMGCVFDQVANQRDIAATIVDLAVRGYLKIVETERPGLLFGTTKDYDLVKQKDYDLDATLRPYEKSLLGIVLGPTGTMSMKALSESHALNLGLKNINELMMTECAATGYFPESPTKARTPYLGMAAALAVAGFIGVRVLGSFGVDWTVAILAAAVIIGIFGWLMPHRTAKGVAAREHALGFKDYLGTAEKYRLQWQESENTFEKYLPYAMSFGIVDKWTKAFASQPVAQPTWYVGRPGTVFNAMVLSHSINSLNSAMTSAMNSAPQQRSGGSGFSGGSSGGGFGGGGGGSW